MRISLVVLAALLGPASLLAQTPPRDGRVDSLLSRITLEEKLGMIAGTNGFDIPGLSRLGIPQLSTADSPFGVRAQGPGIFYAGGIGLAATWNVDLAKAVGTEIGRDARARGRHYLLGPGANMYRSPLAGRNFEYYGEDPFLAARTTVGFITGVQSQNVSATIKHFLGNDSEFARNTTDSRIDERALREIYLPAFEAAVKEARTGAVMASYNLTNGQYMTENRHINVDILKNEWGFDGVLMSDWFGMHDGVASAIGGTDLEMPMPLNFNARTLMPAIQQGTVSQAAIDDKVRRLLRNQMRFGWIDGSGSTPRAPRYNTRGMAVALQSAREAMVLLRNRGDVLPLDQAAIKSIAVIGPNAHPGGGLGGGSATIPTYYMVGPLQGIGDFVGEKVAVHHARGIPSLAKITLDTRFSTAPGGVPGLITELYSSKDMRNGPVSTRIDQRIALGAPLDMAALARDDAALDPVAYVGTPGPMAVRWTGFYEPRRPGVHEFVVQQGGFNEAGFRLFLDGKLVADRWTLSPAVVEAIPIDLAAGPHKVVFEHHDVAGFSGPFVRLGIVRRGEWVDSAAMQLARECDAVVLAVGFDAQTETENWDRTFRLPPGQDELIAAIAALNPRTIVVVNSGGAVQMTDWIERVPAVLEAWYPGQAGGTALAEILFGAVDPSGRLPVTFERRWEDNPTYAHYYPDSGTNRIYYREGVFLGYRGFEQNGTTPLFPFGHGLSYTTFRFANISTRPAIRSTDASPLWDLTFDVANTGSRAGAAVPQVYVAPRDSRVPRPRKELKGFTKVMLQPGETRRVTIPLNARSFAYYDTIAKSWRMDAGTFDILVGSSSAAADIAARDSVVVRRGLSFK